MGNEASHQSEVGEKIFNDVKVKWRQFEGGEKVEGDPRDGHCAASIHSSLFIFGGVCQSPDGESHETNQLLSLHVETGSWRTVSVSGEIPAPRSAATMAAVGSSLYLFGGLSQNSGWFDDVHRFDTSTSTWSVVKAEGKGPSPRDKLSSAVIGDKIYVFGGFGPQSPEDVEDGDEEWEDEEDTAVPHDQEAAQFGWFDDLYLFDTSSSTWSQPLQMNLSSPTPRAAHAMCAVKNHLCIFGGRDSKARLNDLHIFNTETRKWEKVVSQGQVPAPRSFHTMNTVGHRVVVLGGRGTANQHFTNVNIFDIESMQWLQPVVDGLLPAGRGLHSATVVEDKLVVFGGSADFDPETMQCMKYFSDAFFINTEDVLKGTALETENQENDQVQEISDKMSEETTPTRKSPLSTKNA